MQDTLAEELATKFAEQLQYGKELEAENLKLTRQVNELTRALQSNPSDLMVQALKANVYDLEAQIDYMTNQVIVSTPIPPFDATIAFSETSPQVSKQHGLHVVSMPNYPTKAMLYAGLHAWEDSLKDMTYQGGYSNMSPVVISSIYLAMVQEVTGVKTPKQFKTS